MNEISGNLLANAAINKTTLSAFHKEVVDCYETHGFFRYSQLELANPYLGDSLTDILKSSSLAEFITSIFAAAEKESLICIVLCMEMFRKEFDPLTPVYEQDRLNLENLASRIGHQFNGVHGLYLFNQNNKDYQLQSDGLYKQTLYFLHHFCGVKDADLEMFFEEEFQDFYNLVINCSSAVVQENHMEFFDLISKRFVPGLPEGSVSSFEDFNALLSLHKAEFVLFLDNLLSRFERIRQCTEAIVETLMVPVHLKEKVVLAGPGDLDYNSLDIFNQHIKDLLQTNAGVFDRKAAREIKQYIERDFEKESETGGFVGLIKRQTVFKIALQQDREPFKFVVKDVNELNQAAIQIQQDTEDLQTLKRLNYVLGNKDSLTAEEYRMIVGKIVPLLKTYAITYYSDIFELYYFMLMKKSGLAITLLPSRKKGNQEISTCDYKLGSIMAADAKCLIGDGADFGSISYWLNKVGSQVNKTLNWHGVTFGGAVIGIRDKQFPFLDALSNYLGTDPNNIIERLPLFQLMYQFYAEFRRHTDKYPEELKFIVFYYIPATELPATKWGEGMTWSTKGKQEIMFVISTKYANTIEIETITSVFEPVANFLFKFNTLENMK